MSFHLIEQAPARLNRSELAVPGSQPQLFEKAAQSDADVVFLDLEDAVAPDDKEQARTNIIEALNDLDWGSKSMSIRINGLDTHYMYRDVVDIVEQAGERLDLIMIPKVGTASDVYAIDMLVTQIETLTLGSDARFLDSVPGISPLLAARYLAAIIAVSRFPTAACIWAFAGYDLVTDESGDTKRLGKITKRGAPTFRDALYHIGYHTARHCPPIGHTYLDARQRGLDQTLAVIHAAHKANRLCFALLRDQRPYRPVSPEEQARFHHRWQAFHKKGRRRRRPQPIAA